MSSVCISVSKLFCSVMGFTFGLITRAVIAVADFYCPVLRQIFPFFLPSVTRTVIAVFTQAFVRDTHNLFAHFADDPLRHMPIPTTNQNAPQPARGDAYDGQSEVVRSLHIRYSKGDPAFTLLNDTSRR